MRGALGRFHPKKQHAASRTIKFGNKTFRAQLTGKKKCVSTRFCSKGKTRSNFHFVFKSYLLHVRRTRTKLDTWKARRGKEKWKFHEKMDHSMVRNSSKGTNKRIRHDLLNSKNDEKAGVRWRDHVSRTFRAKPGYHSYPLPSLCHRLSIFLFLCHLSFAVLRKNFHHHQNVLFLLFRKEL